jgi:hypothetical protein
MTSAQRQQRCNIRNALMVASVEVLLNERQRFVEQGDAWAVKCVQEMIDSCAQHGVDNHGKTPAFGRAS